jgi:hypothetical protein
MLRLVLLLLLSPALLLGGCKKDPEPQPDPYTAIVGTQWNLSYAVYDYYDATGTFTDQWKAKGPWLPVESMQFLRSTIENFTNSSRYFHAFLPYTRKGDQLSITFPPDYKSLLGVRTISRLTADSLTLEVRLTATSGGRYAIIKDHYYRQ